MNRTRKLKKTYLGLCKVLKERISKDNPILVKAKGELIEVASCSDNLRYEKNPRPVIRRKENMPTGRCFLSFSG